MKEQSYKDHSRYDFGYHIITAILIIGFLLAAIYNAYHAHEKNYSAWLLVLAGFIFLFLYWYSRVFALKAQDRAIRSEENFRYFSLTGKRIDQRITMRQIIALRFADDEEFPALAQKAAEERLSGDAIKKQIKNWRSDWHRA